jgi:hypothetical protein
MVTIERKLSGIFTYRAIFFPDRETVEECARAIPAATMARLFYVADPPLATRCVVGQQQSSTVCIELGRQSDALFADIRKTARYEIGQVEKLGGRVRIARAEPGLRRQFLVLYQEFARAKRTGVAPLDATVLRRYEPYADIFMSYLDEEPMCGHVMLRDTALGRARLLYSASRRLENQSLARLCGSLNRHLHWQEVLFYQQAGFALYDWGGIVDNPNDGISQFKRSFGGEIVKEHTLLCAGTPWLGRMAQRLKQVLAARPALPRSLPLRAATPTTVEAPKSSPLATPEREVRTES